MPLRLGNVRTQSLVDIYRDYSVPPQNRAAFSGVCGTCEYSQLCGGSRARSYDSSGDPLGADPGCLWVASQSARRQK